VIYSVNRSTYRSPCRQKVIALTTAFLLAGCCILIALTLLSPWMPWHQRILDAIVDRRARKCVAAAWPASLPPPDIIGGMLCVPASWADLSREQHAQAMKALDILRSSLAVQSSPRNRRR